jgi:hypothetical protein
MTVPEKPLNLIEAPTGCGKTYSAMEKFLNLASDKHICIIAFPTKVLVEENYLLIQKLKNENILKYKNVNIDILSHHDPIPENNLLEFFFKGSCIILTLHNYLTPRGDFYEFSSLFYLIRIFKNKIKIFIDEVHVLFESLERSIPITHALINYKNQLTVIESSHKLKTYDGYESYKISHPTIFFEHHPDLKFSFFTRPKSISPNNDSSSVINHEDLKKLINTGFPLPDKSNEELVETNNSNKLLNPEIEKFYDCESLESFRVGNDICYENPFIEIRDIIIHENENKAKEIKLKYKKRFLKIVNYNTILVFLRCFKYKNIYTSFKNKMKEARHNDDDLLIAQLLNNLQMETKTHTISKEQECAGFGGFSDMNNSIVGVLDLLFNDFVEIFYKNGCKVEIIDVPNKEIALITAIMFSLSSQIRTSYPFSKEGTLHDLVQWRTMATQNKKLNKISSENLENDSNPPNDSNPSTLVEASWISYTSDAPFTTNITIFEGLPLDLLVSLPTKSVIATSATLPNYVVSLIKDEYDEKVNVLKAESNIPKINKLYLFTTDIDYYQNRRQSWRNMWENFGDFFYNKITKKSTKSEGDDSTYGLILVPTNRIAKSFYGTNLPSNSQHFSIIKGSWERFSNAPFNKKGSQTASYCLRVASIQSSLGAGLNLPNHKFLMIGAEVFKPYSTLFKHPNIEVCDARKVDAYLQLVQGIGRIGRKSKSELENPEIETSRVCFLTGCRKFPTIPIQLIESLKSTYDEIISFNLSKLENELFAIFQYQKNCQVLELLFSQLKEDEYKNILKYKIINAEDFRYLLLTDISLLVVDKTFQFSATKYSNLITRLKLVVGALKICQRLVDYHFNNKKITKGDLKKSLQSYRKSDADRILDGVLKIIIPTIFDQFQQLASSSKKDINFNDLFKDIVIFTFSIPEMRKFLDEYLNDY